MVSTLMEATFDVSSYYPLTRRLVVTGLFRHVSEGSLAHVAGQHCPTQNNNPCNFFSSTSRAFKLPSEPSPPFQ